MNDRDLQFRRNNVRRLCRHTSGIHVNCIRLNPGSTLAHEQEKVRVCWQLLKEGKQFITEAVFENGKRADILVLDDNEAVEIAMTESEESLAQKAKDYPVPIRVIRVKA